MPNDVAGLKKLAAGMPHSGAGIDNNHAHPDT